MRRCATWLVAALVLSGGPAAAQALREAVLFWNYELDATSYTYCIFTGTGGDPFGRDNAGRAAIKTTGSSTTVTAVTAGSGPFRDMAVGDYIAVTVDQVVTYRYIATRTDQDNITVTGPRPTDAAAVDWENAGAGRNFTWRRRTCGTGATAGWINVADFTWVGVQYDIAQMNATSIDVQIQGRDTTRGSNPVTIWPPNPIGTGVCETGNYTAARICEVVINPNTHSAIRVGFKINTDDVGDTGANAEDILVKVKGRKATQ